MSSPQLMPPRKAFWNAFLVVTVPVVAAWVLVVLVFSPQQPQEWLAVTVVLTVIFGIPGILLFALMYRRYRHPIASSARFGSGFLHVFIAVAGLVALAKDPTKHTWKMLGQILFLGWVAFRGVVLILDKHRDQATPADDGTAVGDR